MGLLENRDARTWRSFGRGERRREASRAVADYDEVDLSRVVRVRLHRSAAEPVAGLSSP